MIIFLIILYVLVCLLLMALILLQPSEGGGVSQTLGGGQVQTILGTKTTSFLIKTTAVLATIFLGICLLLAALSGKKDKSLMESRAAVEIEETEKTNQTVPVTAPAATEETTPAKAESNVPQATMPVEATKP